MFETFCKADAYRKCKAVTGNPPIVRIKGTIPYWEYEGFYDNASPYAVYDGKLTKRLVHQPHGSPMRLVAGVFSRNGEKLFKAMINDRYHGSWKEAILSAKTFNNLCDEFEKYFEERKRMFMEKTDKLIAQTNTQILKDGKIRTHSHGGVANLLKVLTKTMHEQGSSIRTIAKVQYAICTQAGIYVPEDFITDVLVAADIDPDVWEEKDK